MYQEPTIGQIVETLISIKDRNRLTFHEQDCLEIVCNLLDRTFNLQKTYSELKDGILKNGPIA